jgi:hypothetical protein
VLLQGYTKELMPKIYVTYTFQRLVELEVENLDPATIQQALDNDSDDSEPEFVSTDVALEDGTEVDYD